MPIQIPYYYQSKDVQTLMELVAKGATPQQISDALSSKKAVKNEQGKPSFTKKQEFFLLCRLISHKIDDKRMEAIFTQLVSNNTLSLSDYQDDTYECIIRKMGEDGLIYPTHVHLHLLELAMHFRAEHEPFITYLMLGGLQPKNNERLKLSGTCQRLVNIYHAIQESIADYKQGRPAWDAAIRLACKQYGEVAIQFLQEYIEEIAERLCERFCNSDYSTIDNPDVIFLPSLISICKNIIKTAPALPENKREQVTQFMRNLSPIFSIEESKVANLSLRQAISGLKEKIRLHIDTAMMMEKDQPAPTLVKQYKQHVSFYTADITPTLEVKHTEEATQYTSVLSMR